jgi:hypothetical protein
VAPDLIDGYLAELAAGLRIPAAEAELILAEAEDHLRETAAAGLETGMTKVQAQQAAFASFGPVRAVVRAHRRRMVTVDEAAMAAWKLVALLATAVGAGGVAGMEIFQYLLRSSPGDPAPVPKMEILYAAIAAGGLVLLAARWLSRRGASGRELLSPGMTAGCFLAASALLWLFGFPLRSVPPLPPAPPAGPSCEYSCNWRSGPPHPPAPDPALTVLIVYAAMAAGVLVLLIAWRLARRGTWGRGPLSPGVRASCFLLASAPLFALLESGVRLSIAPAFNVAWLTPVSAGDVSAAPLVAGAVVAGCLAMAAGYGVQAALRRPWRVPRTGCAPPPSGCGWSRRCGPCVRMSSGRPREHRCSPHHCS